jgi:hypothetical protein
VQGTPYIIGLTDRIVIKVSAQTTRATDVDVHFVYEGTNHISNVQTPLLTADPTALTFAAVAGETLKKGQAVYISGASGNEPVVSKADVTNMAKTRVVGLAATDLASGAIGLVRRGGILTAVDTRTTNLNINPLAETWVAGDLLFANQSGGLTKNRVPFGRTVKAAYTMLGSNSADVLLAYPFENPVWSTAASGEGIQLRLGDSTGATNISIRNYANTQVAFVNSSGNASFQGLTVNNVNISKVKDPVANQDAATKKYVDDATGGAAVWANYVPVLTWTTGTPSGITTVARYIKVGKVVTFSIDIISADSNGATNLVISLPEAPANNANRIAVTSIQRVGGT